MTTFLAEITQQERQLKLAGFQPYEVDERLARKITEDLDGGPARLSPSDAVRAINAQAVPPINRYRWDELLRRPTSERLRTLRSRVESSTTAWAEVERVGALLSLGTLEAAERGRLNGRDVSSAPNEITAARDDVTSWIQDVIARDRSAVDPVLTFRSTDTRSYPGTEGTSFDLPLLEVMAILYDSESPDLRPSFRSPGGGALLPTIHDWLLNRYSLDAARRLARSIRAHPDGGELSLQLPSKMIPFPRIFATVAVGQYAVRSVKSDVDVISEDTVKAALVVGATVVALWTLLLRDVVRAAPRAERQHATTWRLMALMMAASIVTTAAVSWLTEKGTYDLLDHAQEITVLATSASLLGYLVQTLWDDKSMTDSL